MRFLHIVILLDWSEQFPVKKGIPTCLIYDHAFLHYKWINGTVSLTVILCYFTWNDRKKLINGWAHAYMYIYIYEVRNLLFNAQCLINLPILQIIKQSHCKWSINDMTKSCSMHLQQINNQGKNARQQGKDK